MEDEQKRTAVTRLEQEESKLWRWVLLFMILLATAVAALSWERLQNLPDRLLALPILLLALSILFATYAYGRRREVSELKTLLHGLAERAGAFPSEGQLERLHQLIAKSQRGFKELIDSLDDVAFAMSLDGKLRAVNRRMAELVGCPYNEIIGYPLDEFIAEPQRSAVEGGLPRFLEKRHWSGLVRIKISKTGQIRYFDCVLNAILKSSEVVGISALARDVTEERQKETRFTELFETLQEGVYFSTPEGKLLDANPSLVTMLGYERREQLLSVEPSALNIDASQPPLLGRGADDRGGVRAREITLRRRDGQPIICLDTSRAVWDPSGKIIRYQGTLVDVTEQRQMEKQLRQQEEFQRHLLESFPELILVIDQQERYSFVSSRIHDLLGYEPQVWLGKKISEVEESSKEFLELIRSVASEQREFGFCEYAAKHRNRSWRTMRSSASPLYDADNRIRGVVVSVRDITVEKKLEQQVMQSERFAAMGQMIGGFAHELNNPLTSILGLSELLQDCDLPEKVHKQLALMHDGARRAADIVQNLVYFTRPPAPGKSRVDVSDLVQRTLQMRAYSLRKNNINVDFVPEIALPAVVGDPNQLMQVFLNLILNAEQAIHEVRERGTIRIRLAKVENNVRISFQDDGPGITPENLPSIFDPFFTTKRPGRGTGLGLSICKAVLKEHGGNVEASSREDGAVFTVTLPAAQDGQGNTGPSLRGTKPS